MSIAVVIWGPAVWLTAGALVGFAICYAWMRIRQQKWQQDKTSLLRQAADEARELLSSTTLKAEAEATEIKQKAQASLDAQLETHARQITRVEQREQLINEQLAGFVRHEKMLQSQQEQLQERAQELKKQEQVLSSLSAQRQEELESIGQMTQAEARQIILNDAEQHSLKDAQEADRRILERAKQEAEVRAKKIISLAIQRFAGEHTFDSTTSTVALTGDDIKGRIIGREGRNIRSFEAATGVTVLIDDTPGAVVLSAFDPVRREIAREAMSRLIEDGRIHPSRIEEVVHKVEEEIDETVIRLGEEAVYRSGLPPAHPEIVKTLGKLHFRNSFSQNVLSHSVEVAHLTGLMATELGLNILDAKKAGLFHDVGKAIKHDMEGSHAIIGADFIKAHGEQDPVVNAVAAHHDEVEHLSVLGILVSAADAISASRPGARSESMTTYIQRLQSLEDIGTSFEGVEKCFAFQAGREVRVVVSPKIISDEQAYELCRKIVRKIEDDLQYPGQIRVTVIRETRCVEFAK